MKHSIRQSTLFLVICITLLAVGLTACQPDGLTESTAVPPTAIAESLTPSSQTPEPVSIVPAYPGAATVPGEVDFGSYPAPQAPEQIDPRTRFPQGPLTIPPAKADTGVVRGRLIVADVAVELALFTEDIYLAPVIYMEGEIRLPFLSLDESLDPKAALRSSDNEFVFTDVPPGEYGIIIHSPVSDTVVPDVEYGFLIIEVVAGKVLDLGDLMLQ